MDLKYKRWLNWRFSSLQIKPKVWTKETDTKVSGFCGMALPQGKWLRAISAEWFLGASSEPSTVWNQYVCSDPHWVSERRRSQTVVTLHCSIGSEHPPSRTARDHWPQNLRGLTACLAMGVTLRVCKPTVWAFCTGELTSPQDWCIWCHPFGCSATTQRAEHTVKSTTCWQKDLDLTAHRAFCMR